MPRVNREKREDVRAIHTATKRIVLDKDQTFYKTPKGWEIWHECKRGLHRIMYFPSSHIFWVETN